MRLFWCSQKKYAKIPLEQWNNLLKEFENLKKRVEDLPTPAELYRTRELAEQAHTIATGYLPDSGVSASKVGGEVVTTGIPARG